MSIESLTPAAGQDGRLDVVPGRLDVLGALRAICTVVGAVVLYCAVIAALWYALIRVGRRRGRRQAERRAAARAMPVVPDAGRRAARSPVPPIRPGRTRAGRVLGRPPPLLSRDRPWAVAVVLLGAQRCASARRRSSTGHIARSTGRRCSRSPGAWPPDQRALVQGAYELSGASGAAGSSPRTG
jgi:hypothetical protein